MSEVIAWLEQLNPVATLGVGGLLGLLIGWLAGGQHEQANRDSEATA